MTKRYMKVVMTGYIPLDLNNYDEDEISTFEQAIAWEQAAVDDGSMVASELAELAGIDSTDIELTLLPEGEGPGDMEEESDEE